MESMIRDKTVEYLEKNDIIKDAQHGFRSKRSRLTNLLDFFNDVQKMLNNTRAVDIAFLCKWIENWLTDQKQRVVLNSRVSAWIHSIGQDWDLYYLLST